MTDLKTKEKLKFNSREDLLSFMSMQSEDNFYKYAKQYNLENRNYMIVKDKDGNAKFIKVIWNENVNDN